MADKMSHFYVDRRSVHNVPSPFPVFLTPPYLLIRVPPPQTRGFCIIQAILGSYTAVGILEHWDLSMQLFDAKVRSPVRDWQNIHKSNPGKLSGLRDHVYQWAHMSPQIHRIMATDMLLYDYALSVFKLQTAATLGTVWAN